MEYVKRTQRNRAFNKGNFKNAVVTHLHMLLSDKLTAEDVVRLENRLDEVCEWEKIPKRQAIYHGADWDVVEDRFMRKMKNAKNKTAKRKNKKYYKKTQHPSRYEVDVVLVDEPYATCKCCEKDFYERRDMANHDMDICLDCYGSLNESIVEEKKDACFELTEKKIS